MTTAMAAAGDVGSGGGDTTVDAVLGGRLRLIQKRRGHRVGHDAILLAAATDALPGDHILDFGAGVGGAGLALATRLPEVSVSLLELDAELATLAAENIRNNACEQRVHAHLIDVAGPPEAFAAAGLGPASADRVMMNPPFNDPVRHRISPDLARQAAHVASEAGLNRWAFAAARVLRPDGVLTLIHRADALHEVISSLSQWFGGIAVKPVYGRADWPAIRILIHARKASRAPLSLLPGLNLNDADGGPTPEAEAVLRHAQPLVLKL